MFSWMSVKRAPVNAAAREAMYRRELEERAALLFRLGYSKKRAQKRLQANVSWDFELHDKPKHLSEIDRIVDEVFRRGGVASGPPSV